MVFMITDLRNLYPYPNIKPDFDFCDHGWFWETHKECFEQYLGNKRTVLEIGSWLGKSTRFFANNVENIICVDTWEGSAEHKIRIELKEILSNLYQLFIHRRRENPYFSLNEKSLPCVGSERSERPNRANLFRVVG